jgi:toluene monooxygenase system protein A
LSEVPLIKRNEWLNLTRDLEWTFRYVDEEDVFPKIMCGTDMSTEQWRSWEEPYKIMFSEYVNMQSTKEKAVEEVRQGLREGRKQDLPPEWLNALKLHSAVLPLAEFAAVVGNLRAARFGKTAPWRNAALLGAMDELRHTQIPLLLMHEMIPVHQQFQWTHHFYHSKNWVSIAARHMFDELLLMANPVEFALATNFVFETGFTNLQFIGLSAIARSVGDDVFETMSKSIQTDEARHSQIGPATLKEIIKHDPEYVQWVVDKWFWRSWHLFSILTGFCMDYLTPLEHRKRSFKEFMEEWVMDQYLASLERFGLKKPWYWETFLESIETYHHMVYLSAYSYRATVWFDMPLPSPEERAWLKEKYPKHWDQFAKNWEQLDRRWEATDPGVDFAVHGTSIIGFCDLCQIVLCEGTPEKNCACTLERDGKKFIFCSDPCRIIFEKDFDRYGEHKDLVKRVLAGEAPGNLVAMLTQYFGLKYETWGKDVHKGVYPWLKREKETTC